MVAAAHHFLCACRLLFYLSKGGSEVFGSHRFAARADGYLAYFPLTRLGAYHLYDGIGYGDEDFGAPNAVYSVILFGIGTYADLVGCKVFNTSKKIKAEPTSSAFIFVTSS